MRELNLVLQVISFSAAMAAAFYWYKSAQVPLPNFNIIGAFSPSKAQIAPIGQWARDTADFSRTAALCAAGSAVAQALAIGTTMFAAK
jgi:hypothetical protein